MNFGELLFFGSLVALANVVGGLLLARPGTFQRSRRFLSYLVALGAGFMLAAIFIEIVPEVVVLWTKGAVDGAGAGHGVLGAMTLLLAGYLLIHFFEHTIAPHFHFGEETHPEAVVRSSAAYTAIGGLSIHTFFDGASVASAFVVDRKVGLLVFVAVLLHKVPEGFTAASIILASGRSARRALYATLIIGGATLAGVLTVAVLQAHVTEAVTYALPFSAGVTLYVAASDLIPEVNHLEHKNPFVSLVVFGGVALFYLLHVLIES
ncbi:MAG: zinc and cadmium transporter [Acidobacteriota bacterium]|jgi:zinc transporter ZupT|nr:zinc and cadmium transporter [Acidobacteriota bacterium]MDT7780986.1 zinc and cadmium transporter [Acidobacteriota bacterium]